jgi:hypothetical protein
MMYHCIGVSLVSPTDTTDTDRYTDTVIQNENETEKYKYDTI